MSVRVVTMSRNEIERYIPGANEVCVSITSPGDERVRVHASFSEVHRVAFYDHPSANWHEVPGVFTPWQARGLVDFVARHLGAARCVIQCTVGASRSVSIAMALENEGLALYDKPAWWGKLTGKDDPANGFIPNPGVFARVSEAARVRARKGRSHA
jgi:predicted protein tyrosine phosphatase